MNKEIIKKLESHIEMWEEKKEYFDKLINDTQKLKRNLNGENFESNFKCPHNLPDKDAICTECEFAMPDINNNYLIDTKTYKLSFRYPGKDNYKDKIKNEKADCKEWRKKCHDSVCGCGEYLYCECGYYKKFCLTNENASMPKCLYCGRLLSIERYESPNNINDVMTTFDTDKKIIY